jgi:hypothetical protein
MRTVYLNLDTFLISVTKSDFGVNCFREKGGKFQSDLSPSVVRHN